MQPDAAGRPCSRPKPAKAVLEAQELSMMKAITWQACRWSLQWPSPGLSGMTGQPRPKETAHNSLDADNVG
jgi:hypothetical protein